MGILQFRPLILPDDQSTAPIGLLYRSKAAGRAQAVLENKLASSQI
jgi:hypothetical protein